MRNCIISYVDDHYIYCHCKIDSNPHHQQKVKIFPHTVHVRSSKFLLVKNFIKILIFC